MAQTGKSSAPSKTSLSVLMFTINVSSKKKKVNIDKFIWEFRHSIPSTYYLNFRFVVFLAASAWEQGRAGGRGTCEEKGSDGGFVFVRTVSMLDSVFRSH